MLREPPRIQGLPPVQPSQNAPSWAGYGGLPFIIEGVASQWRAARVWTASHFIERCGAEPVTTFVTDRSLQGTVLQQINRSVTLPFAKVVRHIAGIERDDPAQSYYLRAEPGSAVYAELSKDFVIPDTGRTFNPKWSGIWMGQKDNATPFHNDQWHGLLFQVCGHKRFTLVHPFDAPKLQANWPSAPKFDLMRADIIAENAPELAQLEQCYEGVLSPGEVLYVPPYWMHQVITLDDFNVALPLRFDTTQSPDVSLFQLSQRSCLRDLTNQPVVEPQKIVEFLRTNRRNFAELEREFVEALLEVRRLDVTADALLAAVAE
jgi:hypothetical protein